LVNIYSIFAGSIFLKKIIIFYRFQRIWSCFNDEGYWARFFSVSDNTISCCHKICDNAIEIEWSKKNVTSLHLYFQNFSNSKNEESKKRRGSDNTNFSSLLIYSLSLATSIDTVHYFVSFNFCEIIYFFVKYYLLQSGWNCCWMMNQ
jgi:hypothetical protein